ncbi:MAG: hypothetical protein QOD50_1851, partial [Actinomycetota bacterium]|nr:hypothetical protein [Actinomycetota bacterium]
LEDLALRPLTFRTLDLLQARAVGEILELGLLFCDLLAQGGRGCLKRGNVRTQFGALGGLLGSHLGESSGVLGLEYRGILARRCACPTSATDQQSNDDAEHGPDSESDDQGNDGIHVPKYPAPRGQSRLNFARPAEPKIEVAMRCRSRMMFSRIVGRRLVGLTAGEAPEVGANGCDRGAGS